jgi:hypothetical protein
MCDANCALKIGIVRPNHTRRAGQTAKLYHGKDEPEQMKQASPGTKLHAGAASSYQVTTSEGPPSVLCRLAHTGAQFASVYCLHAAGIGVPPVSADGRHVKRTLLTSNDLRPKNMGKVARARCTTVACGHHSFEATCSAGWVDRPVTSTLQLLMCTGCVVPHLAEVCSMYFRY